MRKAAIFALLLFGGLSPSVLAQNALARMKNAFALEEQQISKDYADTVGKIEESMLSVLTQRSAAAKADGDADLAQAYQGEIDRWKRKKSPPSVDSADANVAEIQKTCRKLLASCEFDMQRRLVSAGHTYESDLTMLEQRLMAANKPVDAEAVRDEKEMLDHNPNFQEALAAVAAADKAKSKAREAQAHAKQGR